MPAGEAWRNSGLIVTKRRLWMIWTARQGKCHAARGALIGFLGKRGQTPAVRARQGSDNSPVEIFEGQGDNVRTAEARGALVALLLARGRF